MRWEMLYPTFSLTGSGALEQKAQGKPVAIRWGPLESSMYPSLDLYTPFEPLRVSQGGSQASASRPRQGNLLSLASSTRSLYHLALWSFWQLFLQSDLGWSCLVTPEVILQFYVHLHSLGFTVSTITVGVWLPRLLQAQATSHSDPCAAFHVWKILDDWAREQE